MEKYLISIAIGLLIVYFISEEVMWVYCATVSFVFAIVYYQFDGYPFGLDRFLRPKTKKRDK